MSATGVLNAWGKLRQWRDQRRAIARGEAHPLTMAKTGKAYRITGVAGRDKMDVCTCFRSESSMDKAACVRLLEMGLVPGVKVEVLGNGDPLILVIWGGRVALSRSLAADIFVAPERRRAERCGTCEGKEEQAA